MNRQDWEFVGVRLLGVYFAIVGITALPGLLDPGLGMHWSIVVTPVLSLLAGLILALRTDHVCSLLGDRRRPQ